MWGDVAAVAAGLIAAEYQRRYRELTPFADHAPPEPDWMEVERQRAARNAQATQQTIQDARKGAWLLLALLLALLALLGWGAAQPAPQLPHHTTPVHVPDGKDPVRHANDRNDVSGANRSE